MKRLAGFHSFLASKRLTLWLIALLCVSLVPGTFAGQDFHLNVLSGIFLGCFALNLTLCTLQRIRSLHREVLLLHTGILLTLCGAVASNFGFVGTVNVYEGTGVDSVYRWDLKKDVPLGVTLFVRKVEVEYYPVAVQVGVLRGNEKAGLHVLETGKSFSLDSYTVKADSFDVPMENLKLSIFLDDRIIGKTDTEGIKDLPPDFPYDFKLVAYTSPRYKKVGMDLMLTRDSGLAAEGIVGPNNPLVWNGLSFYLTNLERGEYGHVYAGVQIVKDPGKPVVYLGFFVMGLGALLWVYRGLRGYRQ